MSDVAQPHAPPRWQLGYLSPLPVVDAMHYEFYQAIPHGVVFVAYPLSIAAFTAQAAREAIERSASGLAYLKERRVDRVIFGGLPVSALTGRTEMLRIFRQAEDDFGLVVSSDFEDTIAALTHLGARRVAVAAKWKPAVMDAVAAYLGHAGFEVVGTFGSDYDAAEVMKVNTVASVDVAVQLGRAALAALPAADTLVLGGGTWLALPAVRILEAQFGKPVVSNMIASSWNAARYFSCDTAANLACRLFATDH